jgi:hypothetical protein
MRSSYSKEGRRSEERGADRTSCPPLRQDFASNKIRPAFTNEKLASQGQTTTQGKKVLIGTGKQVQLRDQLQSATNSRVYLVGTIESPYLVISAG